MSLTAKLESIEPAELARCLFEESRDALFVFDSRDMALVDANPSALEMTCLPRGELLERRLFELFDVDAGASLRELMQAFESARPFHSPTAYRLRRGEEPSVSVNVTVSRLGGGEQPLGLFTVRAIDPSSHFVPSCPERKDAELRSGEISEKRKSDELLRASEARYRSLVEYAPVCIHGIDLSGRVSSINPAGLRMISVDDASKVIGREYLSFVDLGDRSRVADLMQRAFKGRASSFDFTCLVNGESRRFSSNFVPIFADDGAVMALTGTTQDITQRVEMQSKLLESESRFRTIFEQAAVGVALLDTHTGRFVRVNRKYAQLIGYSQDEMVDRTFVDITFPEDLEDDLANMRRLHAGQISEFTMEKRLIRKDGSLVWVKLTVSPTWRQGVKPQFHIAIVEDITVRRQTAERLKQSEQRLQQLISNCPASLYTCEASGDFGATFVSETIASQVGYEAHEFTDDSNFWADHIHPEDRERVIAGLSKLSEHGHLVIEYRFLHKDGTYRWMYDRSSLLQGSDGPGEVVGFWLDITERKQAEESLRRSEARLVKAERVGCIGHWDWNVVANQSHLSDEYHRIFGIEPLKSGIAFDAFLDRVHPDDRERVRSETAAALDKHNCCVSEYRIVRPDGNERVIKSDARITRGQDGRPLRMFGVVQDITERKWAEQAVEQSEQKFRTLCTQAPIGVFLTDVEGICDYMNETGCKIVGQSADQSAGSGWANALHPEDRERVTEAWYTCVENTGLFDVETRFLHSNGRVCWARARANARCDDSGTIVGYVGSLVDVTRQKNTMQELLQSEHRYRSLVDNASEGIVVLDVDAGQFVDFNESATKIFKSTPEMLAKSGPCDFSPEFQPDGRTSSDAARQLISRTLSGETVVCEWIHCDAAGQDVPCELRLTRFPDENRQLVRGSITDITQRKIAEQQLRMTRFAVDSTYDAMFVIDRDGNFVDVNEIACERLGYTRGELLTMGVPDVNPHYPMDHWREHWNDIKKRGKVVFESEHTRRDGTLLPVEISKSYFRFEGNEYAFAFVRDITERRIAETQLRITQAAIDQNHGAILRVSSEGRFTYVNEFTCQHLGYTREELLGMYMSDIDPSWPRETWAGDWLRLKTKGSSTFSTIHKKKDGTVVATEVTANYLNMGGEEFVFAFTRDLTERKMAEDKLRERENQLAHVSRVYTMGEMVAGIAHEVNQPLYSIVNFSKAVNNTLNNPANGDLQQIAKWNQQIGAAANRAGQIIKRLRGFVSQQPTNRTSVDVFDLIADAIDFVKYESNRSGVTLDFALLAEPVAAMVDRVQAQQVLVNLLINAIEAVDRNKSAERKVNVAVAVDEDQVEISVADTGCGLPDQQQSSIFDAFVSTKPGGMGMGLAISQTIIESFQGRLWAQNNEQGGATFSFTLPRVPEDTNHVS